MPELQTRYGPLQVVDSTSDIIGLFLARYGEWAWLEASFVAGLLPEGARLLDVGAFVGTFGLGVARSRRLGFLGFVEANPALIPALQANAARAACPASVIEAMVGAPDESLRPGHAEPGNLGSTSYTEDAGASDSALPAQLLTLAQLCETHGPFDLVKLDIEGMELSALQSDSAHLATGQTTLWIECNESPRSIEVAQLLLAWGLELHYFAFPAHNRANFNGDPVAQFPWAYEAGLLAAPKIAPSLSPAHQAQGCLLKPIPHIAALREALWRTPRWGLAEWEPATLPEFAALVGRSLRGESLSTFLTPQAAPNPPTLWQKLEAAEVRAASAEAALAAGQASEQALQHQLAQAAAAQAVLHKIVRSAEGARQEADRARESLESHATILGTQLAAATRDRASLEDGLRRAESRAAERLDSLQSERRRAEAADHRAGEIQTILHALRQSEADAHAQAERAESEAAHARTEAARAEARGAEAARRWRAESETRKRELAALAAQQIAQAAAFADAQAEAVALAASLQAEQTRAAALDERLHGIEHSTVWRATAIARRTAAHLPLMRKFFRRLRASVAGLRHPPPVTPALPALPPAPEPIADQSPAGAGAEVPREHREALAGYFDAAYYLAANEDVRAAGAEPLAHYLAFGWREGRNPSRRFDTAYYLKANSDVAAAGINPLLHYAWAGAAERRLPRPPIDTLRRHLAAAAAPCRKAPDWAGAADHSDPLTAEVLAEALRPAGQSAGLVISASHDDYAANFGGIQNLIADEQRVFTARGWHYLHAAPAAPLPMLADRVPADRFRYRLRLGGEHIGTVTAETLLASLQLLAQRTRLELVVHHLMGHVPELLAELATSLALTPIVWLHDYFTLCPSFTLLRNDVKFCAAPPVQSPACTICVYGPDDRVSHLPRIAAFFAATNPAVLAPSAVPLDLWRARARYACKSAAILPLAHLEMRRERLPAAAGQPVRVAFLGARALHKGWSEFEELALTFADDPRYEFFHLGLDNGTAAPGCIHAVPVRVDAEHRDAMIEAVADHRIDLVLALSRWPETFSFAAHEALAGGAYVAALAVAGNVWPAIEASCPGQGCLIANEAELGELFASGEILDRVASAPRRRGRLSLGGGTADWLLPTAEKRAAHG